MARLIYEHRIEIHVTQDPEPSSTASCEDKPGFSDALFSLLHKVWVIGDTSSYTRVQGVLLQRLVYFGAVSRNTQYLILGEEVRRCILGKETFQNIING